MACPRCRLKPLGMNAYNNWVEYNHPTVETEPDQHFPMPPLPGLAPRAVRGPRICQHCGTVYCEPVKEEPGPGAAPGVPPVPPIVPRPPIR